MAYEGSQRLGELFKSRREKGKPGLPMLSVTLNNGLVDRDSLGRKTDTNLTEDEHLLVRRGDIAYNMMRMWQGASGLSEKDGLVSPAYVVLEPKAGIDSRYAAYLFKTQRMIYLFWAYSYGLTSDRLRLYHGDFARIPVTVPAVGDQERIAELLSLWDDAIETVEKLVTNGITQKKYLMRNLLTGEQRLSEFRSPWVNSRLQSLGTTYGGLTGKSKEDFGQGKPYITYNSVYVAGSVDLKSTERVRITEGEQQNLVQKGDVLFTQSSEVPLEVGMSSVVLEDPGEMYLNSFCFGFRPSSKTNLDISYSEYLFRSGGFRRQLFKLAQGSTRYNISGRTLMNCVVSLPPLEEQRAIASVLKTASKEVERWESVRLCFKKERHALMQQLLTGKRSFRLGSAA